MQEFLIEILDVFLIELVGSESEFPFKRYCAIVATEAIASFSRVGEMVNCYHGSLSLPPNRFGGPGFYLPTRQ